MQVSKKIYAVYPECTKKDGFGSVMVFHCSHFPTGAQKHSKLTNVHSEIFLMVATVAREKKEDSCNTVIERPS